ncbi:MAG: ATP-binding protein [Bacteroidales bacterium]|nr:ATP-binding protein [Bacteroidales bacterium]
MKIKRIIIDNFRAFKHEDIEFKDFNCIIGKNDSGKSTILAALEWFFSDKELGVYDINTNIEYERQEISVELFFTDATFHPDFISKEFLDSDGTVCIKKSLCNPKSFDSEFVKPIPYYSLRVFKFTERMDKKILSFCKCEDLMKECYDLGINKDCLKGIISSFETCKDENSKSLFRIRYSKLIIKMRQTLYNYYSKYNYQVIEDERRFTESEWFEWMYESCYFSVPYFLLFSPQTTISDYMNRLFNNQFCIFQDERIETIAKKISGEIKEGNSFEFLADYLDCNFFPNNKIQRIISIKNSKIIPLQNRGDGFQQKVKNAVFRLLVKQSNSDIFAFEEPETHLHPKAQLEMYDTIKNLAKNSNYQIIVTTHSPYIVKELAKDDITPIVVTREEGSNESKINKPDRIKVLPYDSMNEINYIAFDEPSIAYHIELFGFIHNKLIDKYENDTFFKTDWDSSIVTPNKNGDLVKVDVKKINGVDVWLTVKNCAKKYNWYDTNNFTKELRTLPYCVRNNIDHPLKIDEPNKINGHKAFVNNNKYNKEWIVKKSIDIMREVIINNPNLFV